jgi:gliding motility-associated-like protein
LNKVSRRETEFPKKHYYNYFLGNDPERWASKIHPVGLVRYRNIYPDVNFEFIATDELKYQWIIKNPTISKVNQIRYEIQGADSVYVRNGELIVQNTISNIIEQKPYTYQIIDGQIVEVPCKFVVDGNEVFFEIDPNDIHANVDLVIDPVLIFCTYNGNYADNFGFTATYDSYGNLYAGGLIGVPFYLDRKGDDSISRPIPYGFPATLGAYSVTNSGGSGRPPVNLGGDIAISKYDSSGANLLWATYLGGTNTEHPHSLIADHNNNLIILGTAFSIDFPTSTNALQKLKKTDTTITSIILSKLSEDGSKLLASTYISGSDKDGLTESPLYTFYADDFRGDVTVNAEDEIYIATCTRSSDLPLKNPFQAANGKGLDGYFAKFKHDLSELLWASYLGGGCADALFSIKLNNDSMIYVAGATSSNNLPSTLGAFQRNNAGGVDGFIAALSEKTQSIAHLTYWGKENYDQIYFIDLDNEQRILGTGLTRSGFLKKNANFGQGNKGQFIFRLSPDLSSEEFVTTFGIQDRTPELAPSAFMVDFCNRIYFSGSGESFQTANLPTTPDAMQRIGDGNDFYLMTIDEDAKSLLFATFFGGNDPKTSPDHVDGGTSRFDKNGVVYQSACASCPVGNVPLPAQISDFPTTPNSKYPKNVSERCSNASFKIDMLISPPTVARFSANPIVGCLPLTVNFTNLSLNYKELHWYFGTGDSSKQTNPTYTYTEPGVYEVLLVAFNEENCRAYDSAKTTIEVFEISEADFSIEGVPCTKEISIKNNSTNGKELIWDMGDGIEIKGPLTNYQYKKNGTYEIKLVVNPNSNCPDSITQNIEVNFDEIEDFTMYNVFTPDLNGINDCFKPLWIDDSCIEIEWYIYNRWGEKLFDSRKDNGCWTGINPSTKKPYPAGTYYYIVKDKSERLWSGKSISGTVTLILED